MLASACSTAAKPERFKAADSEGVKASRDETTLYLNLDADVKSPITIPRLAAPLQSMAWQGVESDAGLALKPGTDTWQISWKDRPEGAAKLVLTFGTPPLLMNEIKPIRKGSDGSFYLPAHLATTFGQKVRYEPQPNKNTVGYWTEKENSATWSIQLDRPGRFNVAVLQGCGKGQGGSKAILICHQPKGSPIDSQVFYAQETGHFQNFQWRHLDEIEFDAAGEMKIKVMSLNIKKNALMDIRAIHLIRLPDKK